jgi:hypothetical protein
MASEERRQRQQQVGYRCPACDAELFGWAVARDPLGSSGIVLDRCEECGLVVNRAAEPPDVGAELALLERRRGGIVAPNRRSWQASIGAAQWAGLELERRRLHLTQESARLLLEGRDWIVAGVGTPFSLAAYARMWQTLVNAFTLRENFARELRAGRLRPRRSRERAALALDGLVTLLLALPLAILALPAELAATVAARGGELTIDAVGPPEA